MKAPLTAACLLLSALHAMAQAAPPEASPQQTLFELEGIIERGRSAKLAFEHIGRLAFIQHIGHRAYSQATDDGMHVVQKGDILAKQDTATFEYQLRIAEAQLKGAKASLDEKKVALERTQKLFEKNAASQKEREQATNSYENAMAECLKAEASLANARYDLDACELRAPFAGQAEEYFYPVGTWVDKGKEIVRLSNMDVVRVNVAAPHSLTRRFGATDTVQVFADGAKEPLGVWFDESCVGTDSLVFYAKNSMVPVKSLSDAQRSLPKVDRIYFATAESMDAPDGPIWAPQPSIIKGEDGRTFVWRAKGQTAGVPDKPVAIQFNVEKVPVVQGSLMKNIGAYDYRKLDDPGSLKRMDVLLPYDVPALKDGDAVVVEQLRWLLRPGEKVKVRIQLNN